MERNKNVYRVIIQYPVVDTQLSPTGYFFKQQISFKMRFLILFILITPYTVYAQTSGALNLSFGTQGDKDISPVISFSGDIGYTFFKELYTFGGVKFDKNFVINPSEVRGQKEYYDNITTSIWNFNLYTGIRYAVTVKDYGKTAAIERIGFFPEFRGYFTPHVPNRYYYYNNNEEVVKLTGTSTTQFSYGIGCGFFFGTIEEVYFSIKYEFNTIDPFSVVRTLEPNKLTFSEGDSQHLITLSLYIR